jgi:hypothetical protein
VSPIRQVLRKDKKRVKNEIAFRFGEAAGFVGKRDIGRWISKQARCMD